MLLSDTKIFYHTMNVKFYENQPYYPKVGIQGEQPNTYATENSDYQPLALEITELVLLLHKP